MFRGLVKILPSQLLPNIYKSYVQFKIDYRLSTVKVKMGRVQGTQNLIPMIICNNFEYINNRSIDMVWSLEV